MSPVDEKDIARIREAAFDAGYDRAIHDVVDLLLRRWHPRLAKLVKCYHVMGRL